MSKAGAKVSKAVKSRATNGNGNGNSREITRSDRRTFAITQRGVTTSQDLSEFHAAALADIDAGRADLKEMVLMRAITGQMIAHENLKLKVAGKYRGQAAKFFLGK